MKNWVVALVAIAMGAGVSATLLILTNPERGRLEVYALARGVSAGEVIAPDALRLEGLVIGASRSSFYRQGEESKLEGARAAHDLVAGQLLQRSDVAEAQSTADERLVLLPVKDAPPAVAGQKVDLFVIAGGAENPSVVPFALGVEIRAVVSGGIVVGVPSKQATAFVYAAEAMHLVAVVAGPDATAGSEPPIGAPDQAMAAVSTP